MQLHLSTKPLLYIMLTVNHPNFLIVLHCLADFAVLRRNVASIKTVRRNT
jgi:hypothetical protein